MARSTLEERGLTAAARWRRWGGMALGGVVGAGVLVALGQAYARVGGT